MDLRAQRAFLSDYQGRDRKIEAELALDEDGSLLAVHGSNLSNLGGHAAAFVSLQNGLGLTSMIVHGQTHGGIAQGVGQALLEQSH